MSATGSADGRHAIWFTLWIALRLEPFPFGLLTMIVSLEAIFLSTLVMMEEDAGRFPALEANGRFVRTVVSPYLVYRSLEPVVLPEQVAPDRWRVNLSGSAGEWVSARVSFSRMALTTRPKRELMSL